MRESTQRVLQVWAVARSVSTFAGSVVSTTMEAALTPRPPNHPPPATTNPQPEAKIKMEPETEDDMPPPGPLPPKSPTDDEDDEEADYDPVERDTGGSSSSTGNIAQMTNLLGATIATSLPTKEEPEDEANKGV